MYSPILRNRQSELLAVRHLSESIRTLMMPVLDVAAPTKSVDKVAGLKYVERNIKRMAKDATGFPAVFVDSSELDAGFRLAGGVHPLAAAAAAVLEAGGQPIPVTGLHRDAAHNAAAAAVANEDAQGRLCVRLDATDVRTATLTFRRLNELLQVSGIASSAVHLLFDLQCLYGKERDSITKEVLRLLRIVETQAWAGIIVGGYSIPDQLSTAVATNEQSYLPRLEQDVFRSAADRVAGTPVWFSDYTTLPPSVVELDWRLIHRMISPKALYAIDEAWFVVRGGALSSHPDGYDQYYAIADEIVALDEYCGPDYSYGDRYIYDRSQRQDKPGSPSSWITACVNHHLTFTANAHK